jgi:hypothetical protein
MYVCMYVCVYVHSCLEAVKLGFEPSLYVCMYVCVCVCIYIGSSLYVLV